MQRLDYHSPGPDDLRVRLRRWEDRILFISLFLIGAVLLLMLICSV